MIDVRAGARRPLPVCALAWLAALCVATCGCWRSETAGEEQLDKLKKKPEAPFEAFRVFAEPNEISSLDPDAKDNSRVRNLIKPGHWTTVLVQTKANLFDFGGRLVDVPEDSRRRPIDLELSPFYLATSRGVALPKGQRKTLETLFFAPLPAGTATSKTSTWVGSKLYGSGGGGEEFASADLLSHMPSFQYHLIVLARESGRYSHLKVLDSVQPPSEFLGPSPDDTCHYRVQFPDVDQPLALPTQSLCWTSIACVVWDDVLPGVLDPEQQQAMIDWLHWGGTLIASGPDTLDELRGSFLDDYLPADAGTSGPIDPARLAAWHAHWTVADDDSPPPGTRAGAAWSGVDLVKRPSAAYLPGTGELVAERRVGRGRVVVTAFRLSEPDLIGWRSYDSFFNACLLRRPHRAFDANKGLYHFVGDPQPDAFDGRLVTGIRYFTRDARDPQALDAEDEAEDASAANEEDPAAVPEWDGSYQVQPDALEHFKAEPSVGAWNDFSWISDTARTTLREAAGITVPRRTFVLKMIGMYLGVVVGLNWLAFRLIRRVEWAWIALPVIAVVWGLLVVWLAQLDIGFARSETEVAVLELQGSYPRGHLTRYTAMYSSLSTSYDVRFDEAPALAQPFSADRRRLSGQASSSVTLNTVGQRDLAGMPVASNSTGMIHSEEMFDLGDGLEYDDSSAAATLENGTMLKLSGAAVLRCLKAGGESVVESAWLGDLEPGAKVAVNFERHDAAARAADRESQPLSAGDSGQGGLSLRRLIDCAENGASLEPGEVRLVACHDDGLGGMQIVPGASQVRRATLVVARLRSPALDAPRPDTNLRTRAPAADGVTLAPERP